MHFIANYDVYIFDCDGVILNSNQLKIDAMHNALSALITDSVKVKACVDYFRVNFGCSRFHHVDIFIEQFLLLERNNVTEIKQAILEAYSTQCKLLYLRAELTPGFIHFITKLKGQKFIASGSEQQELREVFNARGLDIYFDGIYGSPTKKSELVAKILELSISNNAILFGDAVTDFEAAKVNNIDFIGYLPYSNVKEKLTYLIAENDSNAINKWSELL